METADPVQEWNRLTELYRQKSDDELEIIANDAYDLTEAAQQVLAAEISTRKLDIKLNNQAPPPPEDDDRGPLDAVCIVDSLEELTAAKKVLDEAGIVHFIGPDQVQELEDLRGSFSGGVKIFVGYEDEQRALAVLREALPADTDSDSAEPDDADPTCPACHSQEIVFLSHDPKDESKFRWRCDNCNHRWTDDGVIR